MPQRPIVGLRWIDHDGTHEGPLIRVGPVLDRGEGERAHASEANSRLEVKTMTGH